MANEGVEDLPRPVEPCSQAREEDKKEVEAAVGATSAEERCPICLEDFEDKAFTGTCFHAFCFPCIVQWSELTNSCPLCKTVFRFIIHNVRVNDVYDQFEIKPKQTRSQQEVSISEARRFHYRTRRRAGGAQMRRRRESRKPAAEERRRAVYSAGLRALPLETGNRLAKVRNITAAFFRENPASSHRLYPWLSREFKVLLGEEHVEFMIQIVVSLIDKVDMESDVFTSHLEPFLHARASHFMHEFVSFARSPYDMIAYDGRVRYDWPANVAPPPSWPRDSWDPEATQNLERPPSPGPSGLSNMQQRILDDLMTTRWDDSPPLVTSVSPITIHGSDSEPSPANPSPGRHGNTAGTERSDAVSASTVPLPVSTHSPVSTDPCVADSNHLPVQPDNSANADSERAPIAPAAIVTHVGTDIQSLPSNTGTAVAAVGPVSFGEVTSTTSITETSLPRVDDPTPSGGVDEHTTTSPGTAETAKIAESEVRSIIAPLEDSYSISLFAENSGDMDLDSVPATPSVVERDKITKDCVGEKGEARRNERGQSEVRGRAKERERRGEDRGERTRRTRESDSDSTEHDSRHRHRRRHRSLKSSHYHRSWRRSSPCSSSDEDRSSRRGLRERDRKIRYEYKERKRHERRSPSPRRHYQADHDIERDFYSASGSYFQRERHQHRSRLYSDDIALSPLRANRLPSAVTVVSTHRREPSSRTWRRDSIPISSVDDPETSHKSDHDLQSKRSLHHRTGKVVDLSREKRRHHRGKKQRAQDYIVEAQLSQELDTLEGQIRENKQLLLKSLLHRERLELLKRRMHGTGDDETGSEQQCVVNTVDQPLTISKATLTGDMMRELTFLDQAIAEGKQQVLRVAKKIEEQHAEEEMDSN